jgi:hypothetical protein
MDRQHDLELALRSRTPIVVVETRDESRLLEMLRTFSRLQSKSDYLPLFRWSVTDGLQRLDIVMEPQLHNAQPADVLRHIRAVTKPGVYVLLDFHPYLADPVNIRLLKDICLAFGDVRRHVVLLSHRVELPDEIKGFSARFEMALPTEEERAAIVRRVAAEWADANAGTRVKVDRKAYELLIRNLSGLPDTDT